MSGSSLNALHSVGLKLEATASPTGIYWSARNRSCLPLKAVWTGRRRFGRRGDSLTPPYSHPCGLIAAI